MRSLSRQDRLAGPSCQRWDGGTLVDLTRRGQDRGSGAHSPALARRSSSSSRAGPRRRRHDRPGEPLRIRGDRCEAPKGGSLTVYVKVNLAIPMHQRQLVALAYTNWGPTAPRTLRCTGKPFEVAFRQPLAVSCRGVAQLVAHLLWEQEAGGSSPPSPTRIPGHRGYGSASLGALHASCALRPRSCGAGRAW